MRGRKRMRKWLEKHPSFHPKGWTRHGRGFFCVTKPQPIQISSTPCGRWPFFQKTAETGDATDWFKQGEQLL